MPRKYWIVTPRKLTILTSEYIDKYALDLGVGDKNLKCLLNSVGSCASELLCQL